MRISPLLGGRRIAATTFMDLPRIETPLSQAVSVLDTEAVAVLRTLDEDGSLLTELIQEFRRDAGRFVVEASAGVSDLDAEPICRAAHALRGSSGSLGMVGLSTLCLELEELAQARRFEAIGARLAQFEPGVERALAALDAFRKGAA